MGFGALGTCWIVTIRIMRRSARRIRVEINSFEGLRGSFAVHLIGWYVLLVPATSLTAVVGTAITIMIAGILTGTLNQMLTIVLRDGAVALGLLGPGPGLGP